MSDDVDALKLLVMQDLNLLLGKTPQGNTALHLSVNLGHLRFTRELCATSPPLILAMANQAGETPLHCVATAGHLPIARLLIEKVKSSPVPLRWDDRARRWVESPILRMTNASGDTALQQALRNRYIDVAKELWDADHKLSSPDPDLVSSEADRTRSGKPLSSQPKNKLNPDSCPKLSHIVNNDGESLLYFAVLADLTQMVDLLLRDPSTPYKGPAGDTALHAAITIGNLETAKLLLQKMHRLINESNSYGNTPLHHVALTGKLEFVPILMDDGASAYALNSDGFSAFHIAASLGHVSIMRELIRHCSDGGSVLSGPRKNAISSSGDTGQSDGVGDAPSGLSGGVPPHPMSASTTRATDASSAPKQSPDGRHVVKNVLHIAIEYGKHNVVKYVLGEPKLARVIDQADGDGNLPLHLAALQCNPKIIRLLLKDRRTKQAAPNRLGETPFQVFYLYVEPAVTTQWNETLLLLIDATPNSNQLLKRDDVKTKLMEKVIEEFKSLARLYANNTTIVSVLMATVTFAAAFTVPGGYISDGGTHPGRPILLEKASFKLFLIANTIALCASLAVSFLYISMSRGDVQFFIQYREYTRGLMWLAFITMALAFASGMYAVVAPGCLWLAIVICFLCGVLPVVTGILDGQGVCMRGHRRDSL